MSRRRVETSLLAATGVAVLAVTFAAGATADGAVPTYGATSASAAWIHVVAGVAMISAGWAVRIVRPASGVGWLPVLVGATWLASDWIGWTNGPALIRTIGMALAPLTIVALSVLALVLIPAGQFSRLGCLVIVVGSGFALVANLVRLTVYDPFFDLDCWSNCTDNSLLIHRDPGLADALMTGVDLDLFGIGVVAACCVVYWLVRASDLARRSYAIVLIPAITALVANASHAGVRALGWNEHPDRTVFAVIHRARGITLLILAIGIALSLIERVRARRAVAALSRSVAGLGSDIPLERVLANATADPELRIGYWIEHPPRLVDVTGQPYEPGPELATTSVVRNSRPMAIVAQSRSRADPDDLARQLGPTLRLAMDNERLRAASLAQIAELQQSRARIVATSDLTRRRLERDLHDGAQQRLLAASFAARLAATEAHHAGETETATLMDHIVEEIHQALNELRTLAHGIHPAELTTAGLQNAIRTLATNVDIPVEIAACPDQRQNPDVEATAYGMVADTIEVLAEHGATYAQVAIKLTGDALTIDIGHDTVVGPVTLINIADRVGATGGRLDIDTHLIHARCPCAS